MGGADNQSSRDELRDCVDSKSGQVMSREIRMSHEVVACRARSFSTVRSDSSFIRGFHAHSTRLRVSGLCRLKKIILSPPGSKDHCAILFTEKVEDMHESLSRRYEYPLILEGSRVLLYFTHFTLNHGY